MKKILAILSLVIIAGCSNAQSPKATPAKTSIANKPIAPYHILTADSVWATPADLKKDHPVVIIYFSPDCSHCQRMMYELKPKMAVFKNIEVIMVTWSANYDLRAIREFRRDYDLAKYHNFVIGTEGYTRLVQQYYNVMTTPFIAIYDKQHKMVKSFDKPTPANTIVEAVKKV